MVDVKEELKRFKYNCYRLMECEEKLTELNNNFYGLSSKPIKSSEEAKYKNSPKVYKNNILDMMNQESELILERDYCLLHVKLVASWLVLLDPDEVELLQRKFVNEQSLNVIADRFGYSISSIHRKLEALFEKMENFPQKYNI